MQPLTPAFTPLARRRRRRKGDARRKTFTPRFESLEARFLLASVQIQAAIDNTIIDSPSGDRSNGAGEFLHVGRSGAQGGRNIHRAILKFDADAAVPAGAHIDSVSVTLNMSRTNSAAQDIALHRVLADWGEGTSNASGNEGAGAAPATNDATWRHRFFSTQFWAQEGGDFLSTPSTTLSVNQLAKYTWLGTQMAVDVQGWVDNPATQFGWIMIGNEINDTRTKRFDSSENTTTANRPVLEINYTVSNSNSPPTDMGLDNSTIAENTKTTSAVTVGDLTAVDSDAGDTHTFSLVSGSGADDNASFQISGNRLQIRSGVVLNHEATSSLKVRVAAKDAADSSTEKAFVITISNVNEPPTDIGLDNTTILENTDTTNAVTVGNLTAVDPDVGDTHTFSFVSGIGADDNASVQISGNQLQLRSGVVLNHESTNNLKVRVAAKDLADSSTEKSFVITISNVNEPPTLVEQLGDLFNIASDVFQFVVPETSFADLDTGDILTLSAKLFNNLPLPGWLSFESSSRRFSGLASDADAGYFHIQVTATDSGSPALSVVDDFVLTVVRNAAPWQNPLTSLDVNADTFVVPLDALLIINELNLPLISDAEGHLPRPALPQIPPAFLDTSGDNVVSAIDVLLVVNQLNLPPSPDGEAQGWREGSTKKQSDGAIETGLPEVRVPLAAAFSLNSPRKNIRRAYVWE